VVEIAGGRVVGMHDRPDSETRDLGAVALIPGLVNSHTHLEFSHLDRPLGPMQPFAGWIRTVIDERRRRPSDLNSIDAGLRESLRYGSTAVGEIATADWAPSALAGGPQMVVFRELIGLSEAAIEPQRAIARQHLSLAADESGSCIRGLSPHAPYSVHPRLLEQSLLLASEADCPVAMHVAETVEELELLDRGSGPLVELFKSMNLWQPGIHPKGTRPLAILELLARAPRALVIHGNFLDDEERRFLSQQPQMAVVYCPRTHAGFGHPRYPLESFLDAGVRVVLGTDSRASNPDLSLWAEMQFVARKYPEVSRRHILEMGTRTAAAALDLEESQGTIAPGRAANLVAISLLDSAAGGWEEQLFKEGNQVAGVMRNGEWVRPI
jgi:cytosine/adenosine deaminase-related metal-dependent hydrolase